MFIGKKWLIVLLSIIPSLVMAGVGSHDFHLDGTASFDVKYTDLSQGEFYTLKCELKSSSQPVYIDIYAKQLIHDVIELRSDGLSGDAEYPYLLADSEGNIKYILRSPQAYGSCELIKS